MPAYSSDDWQQKNYERMQEYIDKVEEENDSEYWNSLNEASKFYKSLPKHIQDAINLPCHVEDLYTQARKLLNEQK
jgi:hypothetical protein